MKIPNWAKVSAQIQKKKTLGAPQRHKATEPPFLLFLNQPLKQRPFLLHFYYENVKQK